MHDPRLGRFFAVDPLAPKYPHNSPYAFSENVVINAVELEGLEKELVNEQTGDTISGPVNPNVANNALNNGYVDTSEPSPFVKALIADLQDDITKANILIDNFANDPKSTSVFPNVSKAKIVSDLRARVASGGEEIYQSRNTCGLAAVCNVFASADPIGYVKFTLDLYQTGTAKLNDYEITADENVVGWAKTATPQGSFGGADLVLLGSLRYVENSPNRFTPGTMDGMTWPSETSSLLSNLVGLEYQGSFFPTTNSFHKYDAQIKNGTAYAIMLHAGWYNGSVSNSWYYTVYKGNSSYGKNNMFSYYYWNYGFKTKQTTSVTRFNLSIMGAWIYTKK